MGKETKSYSKCHSKIILLDYKNFCAQVLTSISLSLCKLTIHFFKKKKKVYTQNARAQTTNCMGHFQHLNWLLWLNWKSAMLAEK